MANARGVIDVVRAEVTRHFLRDVVNLVRDPARGEVERDAARITCANAAGDALVGFAPCDLTKAGRVFLAQHRVRQTTEFAQLLVVEFLE